MKYIIPSIAFLLLIGGVWYYQSSRTSSETVMPASGQSETSSNVSTTATEPAVVPEVAVDVSLGQTIDPNAKAFTIDSFKFGFSMKEIRVTEGDTVTITLTNSGGLHDWVVDEFNARTRVLKEGEVEQITFVADKAGSYEYYCSVGNHRAMGMVGTLIVEQR